MTGTLNQHYQIIGEVIWKDAASGKVQKTEKTFEKFGQRAGETIQYTRKETQKFDKQTGQMTKSVQTGTKVFDKFNKSLIRNSLSLLGVMFFAQQLVRITRSLLDPAAKATGIFEIWGATLELLFLPIMIALLPFFISLLDFVNNLPDGFKTFIGIVVVAVAVIATLVGFFVQLILAIISVQIGTALFGSALFATIGLFTLWVILIVAVIGFLVYLGFKMGGVGELIKSVVRGIIRIFAWGFDQVKTIFFDPLIQSILQLANILSFGKAKEQAWWQQLDLLSRTPGFFANLAEDLIARYLAPKNGYLEGLSPFGDLVDVTGAIDDATKKSLTNINGYQSTLVDSSSSTGQALEANYTSLSDQMEIISAEAGVNLFNGINDGQQQTLQSTKEWADGMIFQMNRVYEQQSPVFKSNAGTKSYSGTFTDSSGHTYETLTEGTTQTWQDLSGKVHTISVKSGPSTNITTPEKYADFIWRPGEGATQISPDDTLIGAKDLSGFGGGGVVVNQTLNINASNANEIKRAIDDNNRKLVDDIRRMVRP